MTNKVISSMILTTCIVFFALGNANPDNLLFLFVSANPLIAAARVVLALGMVVLSFKSMLDNPQMRLAAKYFGLSLVVFGALCMVEPHVGSAMYDYIRLLDWMIIIEAGVIFTSCAITLPQPIAQKKPAVRRARTATRAAAKTKAAGLRQKTA